MVKSGLDDMAQIALRPAETTLKAEGIDFVKRHMPSTGTASPSQCSAEQSARLMPRKDQTDDSDDSSLDEDEPRPVRKKRPNLRYAEQSSDDEYCLRAFKRKMSRYKKIDSSSESETDFRTNLGHCTKAHGSIHWGVKRCVECSDCQAVLARWCPENGCKPCVDEAPVFHPTKEELKDMLGYVGKIHNSNREHPFH